MKKALIFVWFISNSVFSQTVDDLFQKGNAFYQNEKFDEAIAAYEEIETKGVQSSELYYNIGNCYFKLNNVAATIYNYEKALIIDSLNEDALNNLKFAKTLTIDNIEALPKSFFKELDETFIKKLSYDNWAMVSAAFSILGSLLFLLFYFAYNPSKKRLYFVTSVLSAILLVVSIIFTIKEYSFAQNNIQAIIFAEKTEVKNAPSSTGENIFTLHEGTKVKVLDEIDNWKKIRIADGQVGWILKDNLKELN